MSQIVQRLSSNRNTWLPNKPADMPSDQQEYMISRKPLIAHRKYKWIENKLKQTGKHTQALDS